MPVVVPRGHPRLDALYAAEAERLAHEFSRVCEHHPIGSTGYENDAHEALLRDLSRPASCDYAVRAGICLETENAASDGPYRRPVTAREWWGEMRDRPEELLAALLAVAS